MVLPTPLKNVISMRLISFEFPNVVYDIDATLGTNMITITDHEGDICKYELPSGNLYYVYFVEGQFYAAKEICCKTNRVVEEEASDNEYHYSIDIFFNDPDRYTGWSCPSQGTHCSD